MIPGEALMALGAAVGSFVAHFVKPALTREQAKAIATEAASSAVATHAAACPVAVALLSPGERK